MLRIFKLFLIVLPIFLMLVLSQGCSKDKGEETTTPTTPTEPTPEPTPTPTEPTPTPTEPTPTPTTFAVTSVTVSVEPLSYTGTCPNTFNFSAVISANGSGTVTYRWERSDGAVTPTESITFDTAGSKTVPSTWTLGSDGTRWKRLRTLTPNEMVSNQATFTLNCSVPDISSAPSSVNIGDVNCPYSTGYGVIVYNLGSSTSLLNITNANITLGSSFFSIADDSCTGRSLRGGQSCTISIQFSTGGVCPPAGTNYSGNLRILSNDPDEGTVNVSLSAREI